MAASFSRHHPLQRLKLLLSPFDAAGAAGREGLPQPRDDGGDVGVVACAGGATDSVVMVGVLPDLRNTRS